MNFPFSTGAVHKICSFNELFGWKLLKQHTFYQITTSTFIKFSNFVISRLNFNEIQAFLCGCRFLNKTLLPPLLKDLLNKSFIVYIMTATTPSQVNKSYVFCELPSSKFLNHYNLFLERNKLHIYLPPFSDLSSLLPQLLKPFDIISG